jgi:hypothetical protein
MQYRLWTGFARFFIVALFLCCVGGAKQATEQDVRIQKLIDGGEFAAAEKLLQQNVADPKSPITSEPAIQLEVLRRTRYDYALTDKDVLAEVKQSIPDATQADVDAWRKAGDLQYRMIDGEPRYFRRSVSNLFRFNADAKRRR